jgi:uncharacterized protein YwqG
MSITVPLDVAVEAIPHRTRRHLLELGIDLRSWADTAIRAMEPFARNGISLERRWPPGEAPKGWLSQVGGQPNLPPDWEWPRGSFGHVDDTLEGRGALDFLAQVHLPDLPDVPERALLPKEGMLYFFALSQAPYPLADYGSDSWRVLYHSGDPSTFPPRMPPADAGWIPWGEANSPAAWLHDPEEPSGNLFPRCPVRFIRIKTWHRPRIAALSGPDLAAFEALAGLSRWSVQDAVNEASSLLMHGLRQGSPPPFAAEPASPTELPSHVEGALLLLHYARNHMFDKVGGSAALSHFKSKLPPAAFDEWKAALDHWFQRVASMARLLKSRGRTAPVDDGDRARIRSFYDEATTLGERCGPALGLPELDWQSLPLATYASFATLALDHPEFAKAQRPEILKAHPAYTATSHRMLGHGAPVQTDLAEGALLLLQLESDNYGPRFQWWDMGNITFWISHDDLAARRFENAEAEIEAT